MKYEVASCEVCGSETIQIVAPALGASARSDEAISQRRVARNKVMQGV